MLVRTNPMARSTSDLRRYDQTMFEAALAYYGLPATWPRVFTPAGKSTRNSNNDNGGQGKAVLKPTNPQRASLAGGPVWVQLNEPAPGTALTSIGRPRKARTVEIDIVRNLTLDFEYPPAPAAAHAVGCELAYLLVDRGLAEPGLAVEDSGGGCHLVIPLVPIVTGQIEGGAKRVNQAVRQVVAQHIEPLFGRLLTQYGLAGPAAMRLEGYDLAHLLSVPGTWRPSTKRNDCLSLKRGYLRCWLPPHDRYTLPQRRESAFLTGLILNNIIADRPLYSSQRGLLLPHPAPHPGASHHSFNKSISSGPLPGLTDRPVRPYLPHLCHPLQPTSQPYARAALMSEIERVRTAPAGQGNNTLNLAAFRLGQLVADGLLDLYQVEDTLQYAATAGGRRGALEAHRTILSGLTAGLKAPRSLNFGAPAKP